MQHATTVIMLYDMVVTGHKSPKMCKEESSPMMSSVGATRMSHVVSGGEEGRALYLRLYLHRCS